MKVIMFVSNPFTNDPRVYIEAKSLVKNGYEVTVIARNLEDSLASERVEGIQIIRVSTPIKPRHTFYAPIWNILGLLFWQWKAYRRALKLEFDLIHCHDLDTLIIGVRLKQKLGLPLIYDAHEIYGYMMTRTFPYFIANLFLLLEKRLVKQVNHIITVVEPLEQYFWSITNKPVSVIMNCKPLQNLEYQPATNNVFTILYIGVLHQGRAVPMLVDAVKELTNVRCIIGGVGQPEYIRLLEEQCKTTPNASFIGKVPFNDVIPMTKNADAVFMMINPEDMNNRIGLGNKQFEAMVCGRPIICTRGTHSGDITDKEQAGLTVEYNKEALKQAIIKLRDSSKLQEKLGRTALQVAITKYNWQKQEEKLMKIYNETTYSKRRISC